MTSIDVMKKYIPIGVGALVLIVVGILYFFPPNGRMVCEMSSAPGDMTSSSTFVADFSFWRVNTLKITEVVQSLKEEDLIKYHQSLEEEMAKYKDLKYYDSTINVENNTLTSVITIDYNNVDRKKLMEIEKGFSNKLLRIRNLRNIYLKNGAVCKNV